MLCRSCNTENKPTSKFCLTCGNELDDSINLNASHVLPHNENKDSIKKSPKTTVKKIKKNKNQQNNKLLYTSLAILICLVIVVSYIVINTLLDENYSPGTKFEVLSREMYKNVESPTVSAAMGDKYAEFNFLNLVEGNFDAAFQNNKPAAIKSAGISQANIIICRISNGEVTEPSIERKIIEYFDGQGRLLKQRTFFTADEIAYSMGVEKYFDVEYKYYTNGLLNEISTPSVNGSDGHSYRYFYNKNNTLSGIELMYNEVTQTKELKYNNNGVMKWIYSYSKFAGGETDGSQGSWLELLYDDNAKVKRIFPTDENKNAIEGFGYDLQYSESGVAVRSGNTKNKKVIDGVTVFYSTKRTYDSRGLIISVRKYENNDLKSLWLYNYGDEVVR